MRWRTPRVPSFGALQQAAARFCPPYRIEEESAPRLRIRLRDPVGRRPDLTLRHRNERRLFLRANYLVAEADIPGDGPGADGELTFRFRGPLSRQRAALRWRAPVPDGDQWLDRLRTPLLKAAGKVEAVQVLQIRWSAPTETWHLRLETISGSMVSGFLAPLPIAVPLDAGEAAAVIALVDELAATDERGERPIPG